MSETRLDQLASLARTALDDPASLPVGELVGDSDLYPHLSHISTGRYAVDRLDEIIGLINPAELDRENAAQALTVLGAHMNEIAERLDAEFPSNPELLPADVDGALENVRRGLDCIDEAIDALREDPYTCEDCDVNGDRCLTHGEAFRLATVAIMRNPARVTALLKGEPTFDTKQCSCKPTLGAAGMEGCPVHDA